MEHKSDIKPIYMKFDTQSNVGAEKQWGVKGHVATGALRNTSEKALFNLRYRNEH